MKSSRRKNWVCISYFFIYCGNKNHKLRNVYLIKDWKTMNGLQATSDMPYNLIPALYYFKDKFVYSWTNFEKVLTTFSYENLDDRTAPDVTWMPTRSNVTFESFTKPLLKQQLKVHKLKFFFTHPSERRSSLQFRRYSFKNVFFDIIV